MLINFVHGGATADSVKGLLIAQGLTGEPALDVNGTAPSLEEVPVSDSLREKLALRRVRLFHVLAGGLSPGTHTLVVNADGETHRYELKTLPARLPSTGFTVVVASCYYDGYNMSSGLLAALTSKYFGNRPDAFFWVGDNLYVDIPDFDGASNPYGNTLDRYLTYFLYSGYRAARRLGPSFSTYDDHEFWNNYPESPFWLPHTRGADGDDHEKAAHECLRIFQSRLNPPAVGTGYSFEVSVPPLSFFFADTRGHRKHRRDDASQLMTEQDLAKLEEWADRRASPGVLVLGQPLWLPRGSKTDWNPADFERQYQRIWRALFRAKSEVLVVSGDIHCSRLLRLTMRDKKKIYEFVSSPASQIPGFWGSIANNLFRVGGEQGTEPVDVVARIPETGVGARPDFFFGTSAANSIGVLRFAPDGAGNVEVGALFIDHQSGVKLAAPAQPKNAVPNVLPPIDPAKPPMKLFKLRHQR